MNLAEELKNIFEKLEKLANVSIMNEIAFRTKKEDETIKRLISKRNK